MPDLIQYWMDKIEEFKESDLLFTSTKWILIHTPDGIISYFAIMTLIFIVEINGLLYWKKDGFEMLMKG